MNVVVVGRFSSEWNDSLRVKNKGIGRASASQRFGDRGRQGLGTEGRNRSRHVLGSPVLKRFWSNEKWARRKIFWYGSTETPRQPPLGRCFEEVIFQKPCDCILPFLESSSWQECDGNSLLLDRPISRAVSVRGMPRKLQQQVRGGIRVTLE